MKENLINLPEGLEYHYSQVLSKRFTAGAYYGNLLCDLYFDTKLGMLTIQFHGSDNIPFQKIIISKDLLLNTSFELICGLIRDNYNHPIHFRAIDYLSPDQAARQLLEHFSSAKIVLGSTEYNANLNFEQSLAVCLTHVEKLYLNHPIKSNLRRAILELAKDYA